VVCQRLLPHAGRLTTGELAARIKKVAIALDPEWAARRYASAVRERNVVGYLNGPFSILSFPDRLLAEAAYQEYAVGGDVIDDQVVVSRLDTLERTLCAWPSTVTCRA
jgi:hypothetical protein